MSATLMLDNFSSINVKEFGILAADMPAQGSPQTITMASTANITANDFLLLGARGTETAELVMVQSVTDDTHLIVQWTKYPHYANDPAITMFANKLKLYRAPYLVGTVPAETAYAPVDGAVAALRADQQTTTFNDPTGSDQYWYRYTYFNSVTQLETALANSQSERGGGSGHYTSIDSIRQSAGFGSNRNISDGQIASHRDAAESIINATLQGVYAVPFMPVPQLVSKMTRDLAAGYLLNDEYGPVSDGSSKQGQSKINSVLGTAKEPGLLTLLQSREMSLPDATGQTLVQASAVTSGPQDGDDSGYFFDHDMRF